MTLEQKFLLGKEFAKLQLMAGFLIPEDRVKVAAEISRECQRILRPELFECHRLELDTNYLSILVNNRLDQINKELADAVSA